MVVSKLNGSNVVSKLNGSKVMVRTSSRVMVAVRLFL